MLSAAFCSPAGPAAMLSMHRDRVQIFLTKRLLHDAGSGRHFVRSGLAAAHVRPDTLSG